MLAALILTFLWSLLCIQGIKSSSWPDNAYIFYVSGNGYKENTCTSINSPCDSISTVFLKYSSLYNYQINLDGASHEFSLNLLYDSNPAFESQYPTDLAILGVEQTILKLIKSINNLNSDSVFLKNLILDLTDTYFLLQRPRSLIDFTNINIVRNIGQTAVNAESNIISYDGIISLNNVTINGEGKIGQKTLFVIEKVIEFTLCNSIVKDIKKDTQDQRQTMIYANSLKTDSLITIDNTIIQDIYSYSPNSGLIFIQFVHLIGETNENIPVLTVKGSTFLNNNYLTSNTEYNALIKLIDAKPGHFIFENNTFNDIKSIEENLNRFEMIINLAKGSTAESAVSSFINNIFAHYVKPIIIYEFGSANPKFIFTVDYDYLKVNSNTGYLSCTEYDGDYMEGIKTIGCAMIVIREQDNYEVLKGLKRTIELNGEFSEIDLRTDGLPTVGSQTNDSLFRVTNGGELNLDSIQVTRIRSFIGAEEIAIVSVVPESGKYGQISSIPGILTLINSIISGSGSFSEKWSGKEINKICNLNYAPLISASSTGKVTLIGTTVTQSEGTGIYVSGGAQLSIDSTSQLDSNGERVGSLLSGMQTHVVCSGIDASGYPITTSVDINSNSLPSYSTNQETWVFADSSKGCNSIIRSSGILIYGRIVPQVSTGILQINVDESGSRTVKAIVTGNNLNPCDRLLLLLEVKNQHGQTILSQNINESASNAAGAQWDGTNLFSLELPNSYFLDATVESKYSFRVIEFGKGSQSEWVDASLNFDEVSSLTEEEKKETEDVSSGMSNIVIIGISVAVSVVFIVISVIVIIAIIILHNGNMKKKKDGESEMQKQSQEQNTINTSQNNNQQIFNTIQQDNIDYQFDMVGIYQNDNIQFIATVISSVEENNNNQTLNSQIKLKSQEFYENNTIKQESKQKEQHFQEEECKNDKEETDQKQKKSSKHKNKKEYKHKNHKIQQLQQQLNHFDVIDSQQDQFDDSNFSLNDDESKSRYSSTSMSEIEQENYYNERKQIENEEVRNNKIKKKEMINKIGRRKSKNKQCSSKKHSKIQQNFESNQNDEIDFDDDEKQYRESEDSDYDDKEIHQLQPNIHKLVLQQKR